MYVCEHRAPSTNRELRYLVSLFGGTGKVGANRFAWKEAESCLQNTNRSPYARLCWLGAREGRVVETQKTEGEQLCGTVESSSHANSNGVAPQGLVGPKRLFHQNCRRTCRFFKYQR
jgi:hypothetical protein